MTGEKDKSETRKKGAPEVMRTPDPRIVAFVRMLAWNAADQDYQRLLEAHGKAHKPSPGKD